MHNYNTPSPNQDVSKKEIQYWNWKTKGLQKNNKTSLVIQSFNYSYCNLPSGKNNVGYSWTNATLHYITLYYVPDRATIP